jgi:hypothetical protein
MLPVRAVLDHGYLVAVGFRRKDVLASNFARGLAGVGAIELAGKACQTFGVGHVEDRAVNLRGEKIASAGQRAGDIGEVARPAGRVAELHGPISHLFGRIGWLKRVTFGGHIGKTRIPGRCCPHVDQGSLGLR